MTADEPSTVYPYDLARSEESDIRPFFEISTEEQKLVRKLDARILPLVCLLYLFACRSHFSCSMRVSDHICIHVDLDRTNLGNARLQGLPEDTLGGDPTGNLFDWVNAVFFFPYVSHKMIFQLGI